MNSKWVLALYLCTAFFFNINASEVNLHNKTFVIAQDQYYQPFSWAENEQALGIFIELIDEIVVHRMGYKVEHRVYPWARAQKAVEAGEADAFITFYSAKRQHFTLTHQHPLIIMQNKLFVSANSPNLQRYKNVKSLIDLKDLSLIDYIGNGWSERHLPSKNVTKVTSLESIVKMLAKDRADAHISPAHIINYIMKINGIRDAIIELPIILTEEPSHLCINQNSPFVSILAEFDKTLLETIKDGTYENIMKRYK